jgi:hypothetical protein
MKLKETHQLLVYADALLCLKTYQDKLNILLESGVYEPLPKDPTAKVERKVQKLFYKFKTALPTDLKHYLTPYYRKPPHLHGLPKFHKQDIPLRPSKVKLSLCLTN